VHWRYVQGIQKRSKNREKLINTNFQNLKEFTNPKEKKAKFMFNPFNLFEIQLNKLINHSMLFFIQ
jgi:hypothetical protein